MNPTDYSKAELAEAQAHIYRFLTRFFVVAPDERFVQSLFDDAVLQAVGDCLSEEALQELGALKDGWNTRWILKSLQQDYWGLFDVPGARYLAPYESVYRKEGHDRYGQPTGHLYGPSTSQVIHSYRRAGMQVSPQFLDLPDHIGVEIAFIAYLYEQEAAAWRACDERIASQYREWNEEFLREHLGLWARAISEKMLEQARTPLYRAAAYMLQSLIREVY